MKNKRKDKGITLIALIVTIIVLLILAGVSIAMLTGENGILTQASNAKETTDKNKDIEKIKLAISEAQIGESGYQELEVDSFQKALNKEFDGENLQLLDNKDGSFIIQFDNISKSFYVDSNGQIISNENILKISTEEELKKFRDDVNSGNSYDGWYIFLENDITLNINEEWKPIGLYPMENSSPMDETNKPFSGIFDGCGYEINGIYINTTDKTQGFFGLVIGGTIKNLGIGENNNIIGGISTGGIAGYLYNNAKGVNCYNKSDIKVNSYSGGVFGQASNNTYIENCYNEGKISSENSTTLVGGICGNLTNNSIISKCYNIGNINCNITTNVGGIVGQAQKSKIENSYNGGNIQGETRLGGIIGQIYNFSLLQNCYNTGNINGDYRIGGIAGQSSAEIYNCYNIGNILGNSELGGIVGFNAISETNDSKGIVRNVYSIENVYGINNGIIEQAEVKKLEEIKLISSLLGEAFENDNSNINKGFPILKWQL